MGATSTPRPKPAMGGPPAVARVVGLAGDATVVAVVGVDRLFLFPLGSDLGPAHAPMVRPTSTSAAIWWRGGGHRAGARAFTALATGRAARRGRGGDELGALLGGLVASLDPHEEQARHRRGGVLGGGGNADLSATCRHGKDGGKRPGQRQDQTRVALIGRRPLGPVYGA